MLLYSKAIHSHLGAHQFKSYTGNQLTEVFCGFLGRCSDNTLK